MVFTTHSWKKQNMSPPKTSHHNGSRQRIFPRSLEWVATMNHLMRSPELVATKNHRMIIRKGCDNHWSRGNFSEVAQQSFLQGKRIWHWQMPLADIRLGLNIDTSWQQLLSMCQREWRDNYDRRHIIVFPNVSITCSATNEALSSQTKWENNSTISAIGTFVRGQGILKESQTKTKRQLKT